MLVSKEVSNLVKRHLYRYVILPQSRVGYFFDTLTTTDVGRLVERFYISQAGANIVKRCPNLKVLFTTSTQMLFSDTDPVDGNEWPAPWLVFCEAVGHEDYRRNSLSIPTTPHPLFRGTTHLVVHPLLLSTLATLEFPDVLPSLQYLAVQSVNCAPLRQPDEIEYAELIPIILSSQAFPNLRCFLLVDYCSCKYLHDGGVFSSQRWDRIMKIDDPRFFARKVLTEWEYEDIMYGGEETIWDDAETRYRDWRNLVEKTKF
jgi:hypothetical protein